MLLFQMACFAVFIGLLFRPGIRIRGIHVAGLAAVVLLPYVSFMRLNPDSYLYFLLSSHYLKHPLDIFRIDAGTVGQAVPALITALRALFGARELDEPQVISEFLQILFYACVIVFLVLSWASMRRCRKHKISLGSIFAASSVLLVLPSSAWAEIDLHSYNGETLAIVFAAAVSLLAFRPVSLSGSLLRGALVALTAYVKAQALPVLVFLLLMRNRNLTVGRFRINERLLLTLIAAAVFLLCETIVMLFAGHPFLSKVPALLRYMHTIESQSAIALPDFAAFMSQNEQTQVPLRTLPWAVWTLAKFLPSVAFAFIAFVVFYAAHKGFRFRGKVYLQIAILYLAVALLSIALPGNAFDHYVLLALPVIGVLARGFSVAGARMYLPPLATVAAFLLFLLLAEAGLVKNYYQLTRYAFVRSSGKVTQADIAREIPYDLIVSLRQKMHYGNEVFVHGFDSEIYVYTRAMLPQIGLGFMMSKTRSLQDFCDYAFGLRKLAPMFIVDAVDGNWGYVTQEGLALATNPSFKAIVLENYRLEGRYSGIPVYERISKAPPDNANIVCGRAGLAGSSVEPTTK